MSSMQSPGPATLSVSNVGGIESTEVELDPGVTVLEGRNASNRTSLLHAIAAAMGSEQATLKGDADEGAVSLQLDGETYTRTFARSGRTVAAGGDPYLEDAQVADLFAFLFEGNEARRAAVGGEDLREIIMRPIDTEALQSEIVRLQSERERIDRELSELDDLAEKLPDLERERGRLRDRIAEKREALEGITATIEALETDPEQQRSAQDELDERMGELNEKRSELEDVEFRIGAEEDSIESLGVEREQKRAELDDVPEVSADDLEMIETELTRLRERKRSIDSTVNRLHGIVEFNEEMLSGDRPDVLSELGDDDDREVTDELLAGDDRSVVCWTCGSDVERAAIDGTQDRLRDLRSDLVEKRKEIDGEIQTSKEEARELREGLERREQIDRRLDRIEAEIEEREATLAEHRRRREQLAEEIEALEAEVTRLRAAEENDEVLEHHREKSQLEFELGSLEDDLAETDAEIKRIENRLAERDDLADRREAVAEELVECRTRVEEIESEAVEGFNEHMDTLLELLEYDNVERVWIETTEVDRREGRRTVTVREFDLHVVRTADDGTAYEDSVATLSESEREIVGLVFALAGYLAHDVHERVPFVLLDSMEAIDADRIATLVDYFSTYAPFLVVALLLEDARVVDSDHRITEI